MRVIYKTKLALSNEEMKKIKEALSERLNISLNNVMVIQDFYFQCSDIIIINDANTPS